MDARNRILDATERLLGRLGYQKMTMDDIAREGGIGRRTIYLHFPSKEEVALCTIDRIVDGLVERLRGIARSEMCPAEQIRAMLVVRVMHRLDSVQDYYHSFHDLFAELRPAYLKRRELYFAAEAEVISEALEAGRCRGGLVFDDAQEVAETLLAATNSLLPYGLSARELGARDKVQAQVERIAELLLTGLAAHVGGRDGDAEDVPTDRPASFLRRA